MSLIDQITSYFKDNLVELFTVILAIINCYFALYHWKLKLPNLCFYEKNDINAFFKHTQKESDVSLSNTRSKNFDIGIEIPLHNNSEIPAIINKIIISSKYFSYKNYKLETYLPENYSDMTSCFVSADKKGVIFKKLTLPSEASSELPITVNSFSVIRIWLFVTVTVTDPPLILANKTIRLSLIRNTIAIINFLCILLIPVTLLFEFFLFENLLVTSIATVLFSIWAVGFFNSLKEPLMVLHNKIQNRLVQKFWGRSHKYIPIYITVLSKKQRITRKFKIFPVRELAENSLIESETAPGLFHYANKTDIPWYHWSKSLTLDKILLFAYSIFYFTIIITLTMIVISYILSFVYILFS